MSAFLPRASAYEPFAPSGAVPGRLIDLAICALLAVVTVGLLVAAV